MRIYALTTGTAQLKRAFLYPRRGPARQPGLFLPSPWLEPLPIHCWAVEHDGGLTLVDTGETADVSDIPFARFKVTPEDELPRALESAGLSIDAVSDVVLTHLHGDHMDGAVHVGCAVQVHDRELEFARSLGSRVMQRLLKQPVPEGVDFQTFGLDDGPFGSFPASRKLSPDGRIVAVPTPGHTVGHISVICIDDQERHVFLAGDATDTVAQLHERRFDAVSPKPKVSVETMERILDHAKYHPTVYLPAHDPESAARLAAGTTLSG